MSKILDKVFTGIDYLLGIFMALMVSFVFLNAVLRTVFNSGLVWSEELSRYTFVFITYLGAIGAMRANAHLGMDTVVRRFPGISKVLVYICNQILIMITMLILLYGSYVMTIQNLHSKAAATGIPLGYIYAIGILTSAAIAINNIANIIKVIKNPKAVEKMVLMHESEEDDIVDQAMADNADMLIKKED